MVSRLQQLMIPFMSEEKKSQKKKEIIDRFVIGVMVWRNLSRDDDTGYRITLEKYILFSWLSVLVIEVTSNSCFLSAHCSMKENEWINWRKTTRGVRVFFSDNLRWFRGMISHLFLSLLILGSPENGEK